MIMIEGLRIAGIYLMLKSSEQELDCIMKDFAEELETYLYDRLSIEEMEELTQLYSKNDEKLSLKI